MKKLLLIALFIPLTQLVQAATPPASLPIEIEANSLISQDSKGQSIYQGNVIITQGTTEIKGDKATIIHPNRAVTKSIIIGSPAKFQRFDNEAKKWVKGHADKITYQTVTKTILLEGNAFVSQEGENSISSPRILYNAKDKTLKAMSNKNKKQRVKVIFSTEEKKKTK